MVQTTILDKMTLFQTGPQRSRDQNGTKWSIFVHFGPRWSNLVHLGPPAVLWPFLKTTGSPNDGLWTAQIHVVVTELEVLHKNARSIYSQLRQHYLKSYFQAKVGKELSKQFPEPTSVGKLDVNNFEFWNAANTLQARNYLKYFHSESSSKVYPYTGIGPWMAIPSNGWIPLPSPKHQGTEDQGAFRSQNRGFAEGWLWRMFPGTKKRNEGTFGCSPVPKNGRRAHSDVPRYWNTEWGYIRMFPGTENRNEGTFAKTALLRNCPFSFLSTKVEPQQLEPLLTYWRAKPCEEGPLETIFGDPPKAVSEGNSESL